MRSSLIFSKNRFRPLFWTQFFGATNDNIMKNALVVLITFQNISLFGMTTESLVALMSGLLILPFFLFSPLAGQVTDKYDKRWIVIGTKWAELGIVLLAAAGFYFQNYSLLTLCIFLMGAQSAFFGPVKYSSIPDLVSSEDLVRGNAIIETGTFLAILVGTILGGFAAGSESISNFISLGLIVLAALGILSAHAFPSIPSTRPNVKLQWNPWPDLIEMNGLIRQKESVFNSILGVSWFWFFGAGILSLLPLYCKNYLFVDASVVTLMLAMFTIGIGVGSMLCEKLSFHRVEIGLVPIGSLGMSLFMMDLFLITPPWLDAAAPLSISQFLNYTVGWRLCIDLFLLSAFGGFFIVPLYALIQWRTSPESRSRVIAANNIANALFMVLSSVLIMAFIHFGLSLPQIFLIFFISNIVVSIYIYSIVPEFTLRFLGWVLVHFLYRVHVTQRKSFPIDGPAVVVSNHVSYVDWLVLGSACPRPMRFVMYYKFFNIPILKYLMKQAGVIPIASAKENPKILERAMETIARALESGDMVCIFPEGTITRNGEICPFKPGIERIIQRNPVPVIPLAIHGLWGSIFSFKDAPALKKFPRRILFPVRVEVGTPIPPERVKAEELQKTVLSLLQQARATGDVKN